jgi:hypothetical protein
MYRIKAARPARPVNPHRLSEDVLFNEAIGLMDHAGGNVEDVPNWRELYEPYLIGREIHPSQFDTVYSKALQTQDQH